LLKVREVKRKVRENIHCQGRPGNVRDTVPVSEYVREICEKVVYYWLIME